MRLLWGICRLFVGDGFIRPEVASLCVNGRYLPRIIERAYLGADKSAPYNRLPYYPWNRISVSHITAIIFYTNVVKYIC
ncbi:MAG: hypothetical protein FWG87_10140 [Defluviitaleaceae bacterium]|nr:hypothetical protein [Defluviitaleaceae bacterium]